MLFASLLSGALWLTVPSSTDQNLDKVENKRLNTADAPPKIVKQTATLAKDDVNTEESIFLTQEFRDSLVGVAQAYESDAKYPLSSRPVKNPEQERVPAPFSQSEVNIPTFDEDGNATGVSLSAAVDAFQYYQGDTISVRLVIQDLEPTSSALASLNFADINGQRQLTVDRDMTPVAALGTQLVAEVSSYDFKSSQNSGEFSAVISVNIDGYDHVTTVPFMYGKAAAKLIRGVNPTISEEYLKVPVELAVYQQGYYYLTAYLDDAETGRPLIKLQREGFFGRGTNYVDFNAHQRALKDAGVEGPYTLRVSKAYRAPDLGQGNALPVSIVENNFDVPAFPFSDYLDREYLDPLANERLDLINAMAGESNQENEVRIESN